MPPKKEFVFDSWLRSHKGVLFKVVRAYASKRQDQGDLVTPRPRLGSVYRSLTLLLLDGFSYREMARPATTQR